MKAIYPDNGGRTRSRPRHHLDIDHSRGRIVHRQIWATDASGIDFPGAAQVFRIRRDVFDPCGQRISKEIVHGITSLAAATAEAVDSQFTCDRGDRTRPIDHQLYRFFPELR